MSDPTALAPSPPAPVAPAPAPKEPTIKDRASGLLSVMTDAQRHNAPITPWMLTELAAVVGQVTGNKAVTDDTAKKADANMEAQRQAMLKAQQDRANQMAQQQAQAKAERQAQEAQAKANDPPAPVPVPAV